MVGKKGFIWNNKIPFPLWTPKKSKEKECRLFCPDCFMFVKAYMKDTYKFSHLDSESSNACTIFSFQTFLSWNLTFLGVRSQQWCEPVKFVKFVKSEFFRMSCCTQFLWKCIFEVFLFFRLFKNYGVRFIRLVVSDEFITSHGASLANPSWAKSKKETWSISSW